MERNQTSDMINMTNEMHFLLFLVDRLTSLLAFVNGLYSEFLERLFNGNLGHRMEVKDRTLLKFL